VRLLVLSLSTAAGSLSACAPAGPPTAEEVCFEREGYLCRRELIAGRIARDVFEATCSDDALLDLCAPAAFAGCAPGRSTLELCLDALSDFDRLGTSADRLSECADPCLAYTT
jgi:hypothetical protein